MGCFLGCFGGEKDRKRRTNRANPQVKRNRVQNVHQQIVTTAEQTITETAPNILVSELRHKPTGEEQQLSPSPRKRVTFNSNITTYEHVSIHESIDSLPEECNKSVGRENQDDLKTTGPSSHSPSDDDRSVVSSVGSYPPNHRYHNARDSDDEYEEYGDSDLDDDFDDSDDEDDYDDYDECNTNSGQEVSAESFLASSMESRTGNFSINEEVESCRDKSDYINSVLKPIENINQWKVAKSKGTRLFKPQENQTFEQELFSFKSKSDRVKNENQEIAVDASLSNWLLVSPQKNVSRDSSYVRRFEDRPILGALTVEELRQISVFSSPKKSPCQTHDEMPIIGTVGTHWNHSVLG